MAWFLYSIAVFEVGGVATWCAWTIRRLLILCTQLPSKHCAQASQWQWPCGFEPHHCLFAVYLCCIRMVHWCEHQIASKLGNAAHFSDLGRIWSMPCSNIQPHGKELNFLHDCSINPKLTEQLAGCLYFSLQWWFISLQVSASKQEVGMGSRNPCCIPSVERSTEEASKWTKSCRKHWWMEEHHRIQHVVHMFEVGKGGAPIDSVPC